MSRVCFPEPSPTSRMLHSGSKIPRGKEAQLCGLGSCGGVQGLRHWCGISPWNHCETTDMTAFRHNPEHLCISDSIFQGIIAPFYLMT